MKDEERYSSELNMSTPIISIIVPIYNAEVYLNRCLDSILEQTFQDFEVLMIDDGSTDGSANICNSYVEQDKRLLYIYQDNSGPDIARKTGTINSRGRYIVYVDADDYISPDMLETEINIAINNNVDLVCSQIVRFNEKKEWNGSVCVDELLILADKSEIMQAFFETGLLIGTYYAKLIKRSLIEDYDFIQDGLIGEDITATLYMIDNASKIAVIPNKLYYYYQNHISISHAKYSYRHAVSLDNYIRIRDYYCKMDVVSKARICGFFASYQMAVATAMGRNGKYESIVGETLRKDMKEHWKSINDDSKTASYMKTCIRIYICAPRLFVMMYRVMYLVTGR